MHSAYFSRCRTTFAGMFWLVEPKACPKKETVFVVDVFGVNGENELYMPWSYLEGLHCPHGPKNEMLASSRWALPKKLGEVSLFFATRIDIMGDDFLSERGAVAGSSSSVPQPISDDEDFMLNQDMFDEDVFERHSTDHPRDEEVWFLSTTVPPRENTRHRYDVVCRNDRLVGNSIGNRRFRAMATLALGKFVRAKTSTECWGVVQELVSSIQTAGGRFLTIKDNSTTTLDFRQALDITACELKRMAKASSVREGVVAASTSPPSTLHQKNDRFRHPVDTCGPNSNHITHYLSGPAAVQKIRSVSWHDASGWDPSDNSDFPISSPVSAHGDIDDEDDIIDMTREDLLRLRQSFVEEHDWPLVSRVKCWLEQGQCPTGVSP